MEALVNDLGSHHEKLESIYKMWGPHFIPRISCYDLRINDQVFKQAPLEKLMSLMKEQEPVCEARVDHAVVVHDVGLPKVRDRCRDDCYVS